jgi:HAD superfamily hydrolase (TIGR01509 family)
VKDLLFCAARRKTPHPDIFLYATRAMGVESVRCIVIEDSVAGVIAAKSAGATGVVDQLSAVADYIK